MPETKRDWDRIVKELGEVWLSVHFLVLLLVNSSQKDTQKTILSAHLISYIRGRLCDIL